MSDVLRLLVVLFLFGGGSLFLLAISPVGKAIATRISGRAGAGLSEAEVDELRALHAEMEDVRALRTEVAELAERVDFAERLLAQQRESGRIGPANP